MGGSNEVKPVNIMNSILTQGPAYGWVLQGHSVEDSLGRGTGETSSQEKPWKQEKKQSSHFRQSRGRSAGRLWVGSEAGTEWWGWGGQRTFVEQTPGTRLDSSSVVPALNLCNKS